MNWTLISLFIVLAIVLISLTIHSVYNAYIMDATTIDDGDFKNKFYNTNYVNLAMNVVSILIAGLYFYYSYRCHYNDPIGKKLDYRSFKDEQIYADMPVYNEGNDGNNVKKRAVIDKPHMTTTFLN